MCLSRSKILQTLRASNALFVFGRSRIGVGKRVKQNSVPLVMAELIRHRTWCLLDVCFRYFHVRWDNWHRPCKYRGSCHATSCKEQGLLYNVAYKQFGNILHHLNKDLNPVPYMTHMAKSFQRFQNCFSVEITVFLLSSFAVYRKINSNCVCDLTLELVMEGFSAYIIP